MAEQGRRPGLRARLNEPAPIFGTWVHTRSPEMVETIGASGFDVVLLDLEHGEFGIETVPDLLRAAEVTGCWTIVRVPDADASLIGRVLDAGADGVMVPNVTEPAAARLAVQASRYPPEGDRGASPAVRAARYTIDSFDDARARAGAAAVMVQVEGPEGIAALDEVLDAGPDLAFVGTFDLSQRLGVPGQVDHPAVAEALADIAARASARGIAVGTWAPNADVARRWAAAGVRLVTVSNSAYLFGDACRALVTALHAAPA